jgi:hypothetical protein
MSGVFQSLTPNPPHRPASLYPPPPPPLERGEDTLAGWKVGGGSIFWKTPDTALYSTYVLCASDHTSGIQICVAMAETF